MATVQPPSKKRWSHRTLRYCMVAAFTVGCAVCGALWSFSHWHDPDRVVKLINFISVWYPFALSVFLAFIPDMDKSPTMRRTWRVGIIAGGFVYSLILWKQQSLTVDGARQDQQAMITHTDQKIDGEKQEMKTELKAVSDHSDEKIAMVTKQVKSTDDKLSDLFSKTTTGLGELGVSIGKVGKPDPPAPAVFRFSLWNDDPSVADPVLVSSLRPDKDGVFTVDFLAGNNSKTAAHEADIWVDVCLECSFAKEPEGFDRPTGMPEYTRHMRAGLLNPGASLPKKSIAVKLTKDLTRFPIDWRYSCEVCGGPNPAQVVWITALPALGQ